MTRLSRRTILRGLGGTMALPWLEAMSTPFASANENNSLPRRIAFVYVPNGVDMPNWKPESEGREFDLPSSLEPLVSHRDSLQVLTGLSQLKANPNGDGPGDHARASASFLTGCQALKTSTTSVKVGVSIDQILAEKIGGATRFSSLELGCDKGKQAGSCDSGYSCAYQFNLAWRTPTMPLPPEVDPRQVFQRLFGSAEESKRVANKQSQNDQRKSVLDYVRDDAASLKKSLGANDSRKLDEYLFSIREIEHRLVARDKTHAELPEGVSPVVEPAETYEAHIRLMYDLLLLAFQTDSTRIATLMIAHDGSNRSYPFIGVPEGHHDLSHHGRNQEKRNKLAAINRFHVTQFAYFLERLKQTRERDGSLLDQSMIVYGSGISDGDRHNHNDLPVILAGKGGGSLQPGRHVVYEKNTPMNNLYIGLAERMGVELSSFGDSNGKIENV